MFPGAPENLRLSNRNAAPGDRIALAVYALDDTRPPGVSNGTVTYRRDVLDQHLLGARIGNPGQAELTLQVPRPAHGSLWFTDLCYGARAPYRVSVDGDGFMGSTCDADAPSYDQTGGGRPDRLRGTGPMVTVKIWTTASRDSATQPGERAVFHLTCTRGLDPSTQLAILAYDLDH